MILWLFRKHRPDIERIATELDIAEAQNVRAEIEATRSRVAAGFAYVQQRREENHFGDDLELTFTPRIRGRNA